MPRSSRPLPLDPGVFTDAKSDHVICMVCPPSHNGRKPIRRCHATQHASSQKHLKHLQDQKKRQKHETGSLPARVEPQDSTASFEMEYEPQMQPADATPPPPSTTANRNPAGVGVPLSHLWEEFQAEGVVYLDDYFEEMQQRSERGEPLFSVVLPPPEDELGIDDTGEDFPIGIEAAFADHGIDFDAVAGRASNHTASHRTKSKTKDHISPEEPLYPWKTMPEFLTHLLFSSPRLRFSQAQKNAILQWAKEIGAPEVPSLYAVNKTQERLMELLGSPTEKVTTPSGCVFYLNGVSKAIAMDFANPLTRFAMREYPEDGQGHMSQVHHGTKMLEDLPEDLAPPCARVDHSIYFVNELLRQSTGQYFIPKRFFQARMSQEAEEPALLALGHQVLETEEGFAVDPEMVIVPVSTFLNTFVELQRRDGPSNIKFTLSSTAFSRLMPNPLREKSGGRMVYAVPLIVFMDDVSANISKQWNKHHVIYASNALLPREMLEREFTVRFVSGSPHASPMELMQGLKESIKKAAENGIFTFDVKDQEEVMLDPYILIVASDNPMQAEECSHGGLRCNYFCRTCNVGGTTAEKKTEKGYNDIFQCGEIRSPEDTRTQIKRQVELSKLSGGTDKVNKVVSQTGVRDTTCATIINRMLTLGKVLRKRMAGKPAIPEAQVTAELEEEFERLLGGRSVDDCINPLLGMRGLDIHKDTPTEILHTILLGVVKYFWGQTAYILDKANLLDKFRMRLESIEKDGLNTPSFAADYIVRYKGGLVGKHFKSLAQLMAFLVYDLVPQSVLDAWVLIGRLVVLLWHTSIDDLESYLATLSRTIEDFLSISAKCAPSIILSKPKFHFLLHLPMFIRRFGPAILYSTERYESFNHVFRLASIHSNRQAPSRDACQVFAEQEAMKHVVSGGHWYDPVSCKWVNAGPDILRYFNDHPYQRRFLGFPEPEPFQTGTAKLSTHYAKDNGPPEVPNPISWEETQAAQCLRGITVPTTRFQSAVSVTAMHGDRAVVQKHVIIKHDDEFRIGKITEILVPFEQSIATHVVVSIMEFLPELHCRLHMPRVKYPMPERTIVIPPSDVICAVNIQHDCITSQCNSTRTVLERQERLLTTRTRLLVDHAPTNAFILNIHSLHNYWWIVSAIPIQTRHQIRASLVPDHALMRSHAVETLRSKKGADGEDAIPNPANEADPPPFDRQSKTRQKGKAKGKSKVNAVPMQSTTSATFMNRNLPLFKIPAPALDEPGIPDYIDSLMKDILTKQRAMIKNKRQCLVTFNELVMESMARTVKAMGSGQSGNTEGGNSAGNNPAGDNPAGDNPTGDNSTGGRSVGGGDEGGSSDEPAPRDWVQADFWEFVDIVLCDLRAQAAEEEETLDDQKEHLEK
ncbi:hypothetical protein L210DRAFT_1019310 [Boletus edulis BED1]|uniref:Uncharacterized protein n=1 Tax=Boletus edulis BED1 TaxID=1328754 RepID=A0AAD4BI00_BOLED|nr:hypothetical protein L210DRAFT_1019310 [Boletus edulis BED1]